MARTALVTGGSGQDGSYLVELLLAKGYQVHVLDRLRSGQRNPNLQDSQDAEGVQFHVGDLLETERLTKLVKAIQPDELYNLAAQSFVPPSWELPMYTVQVNALGPLALLEAIRHHAPATRFYQATSSEAFGHGRRGAMDESTYHHPRSPYGATKSFGMNITRNYRESFGLFACNGILFNHESERRGPQFVTRKVSMAVAAIQAGRQKELRIGNLEARRDWGHAEDYVRAMWMILAHDKPDDYVVATGKSHSIRDFVERAFAVVGTRIHWEGKGVDEVGRAGRGGPVVVRVDPAFFRPADVDALHGDAGKARRVLGWEPSVDFDELVQRMVRHDLGLLGVQQASEATPRRAKATARGRKA